MVTIPPNLPLPPGNVATARLSMPVPVPAITPSHAPNPFRAVFFKEARESGPFVLIIWGIVLAIVAYIVLMATEGLQRKIIEPFFMLHEGIMAAMPIAVALIGIVMGFLSYRTVGAFDAWAYFIHRPISRSRMFAYKTAVGLLMYAIAVGVPMVVFLMWVIAKDRATPFFQWQMLLPYIADFLMGATAFLAGSLPAQRNARRFGTRFIPGLTALGVVIGTVALPYFSLVLLVNALVIPLLFLAAWGSTLTHGENSRGPAISRVSLGVVLFIGLLLPGFLLNAIAFEWMREYMQLSHREPVTIAEPFIVEDGNIAIRLLILRTDMWGDPTNYYRSHPDARYDYTTKYLTPDGQPLTEPPPLKTEFGVYFNPDFFPSMSVPNYRTMQSVATSKPIDNGNWWYLPHDRALVNFTYQFHRRSLSVGPSGFHDGNEPLEPFDPVADDPFVSRHAYYVVNFQKKTISSISFPDEELRAVQHASSVSLQHVTDDQMAYAICLTDRNIHVIDSRTMRRLAVVPRRQMNSGYGISVGFASEGRIVVGYRHWFDQMPPTAFDVFDKNGKLLQAAKIDPRTSVLGKYVEQSDNLHEYPGLKGRQLQSGLLMSLGMPMAFVPPFLGTFSASFAIREAPYMVLGVAITNVVAAVGMLLLARRYGLGVAGILLWIIGVLIFGPMLLVVFAGSYVMPARVRCTTCGSLCPVDVVACPACGASFAAPAANGTEIFAQV